MKTILILMLVFVFMGCASTQYFQKTYHFPDGTEKESDTIVYVRPFGVLSLPFAKEKGVKYRLSVPSLLCGAFFFPTIAVPVAMWGFFLFEAKEIKDDKLYNKLPEPIWMSTNETEKEN